MEDKTPYDVICDNLAEIDRQIEQAREDFDRERACSFTRLNALDARREMFAHAKEAVQVDLRGYRQMAHSMKTDAAAIGNIPMMGEKSPPPKVYYHDGKEISYADYCRAEYEACRDHAMKHPDSWANEPKCSDNSRAEVETDTPPSGGDKEHDISARLDIVVAMLNSKGEFGDFVLVAEKLAAFVLTGRKSDGK